MVFAPPKDNRTWHDRLKQLSPNWYMSKGRVVNPDEGANRAYRALKQKMEVEGTKYSKVKRQVQAGRKGRAEGLLDWLVGRPKGAEFNIDQLDTLLKEHLEGRSAPIEQDPLFQHNLHTSAERNKKPLPYDF